MPTKAAVKSLLPLLRLTGQTFQRTFAWGAKDSSTITVVEPFVVEVESDTSVAQGVLRHGGRLRRPRPDLAPGG